MLPWGRMSQLAPEKVLDLTRYLEARTDVSFAFLSAPGDAVEFDIAVYFTPPQGSFDYQSDAHYPAEREVCAELERIAGREVELLVLNRASPTAAASALHGVPLGIRDWGLYTDFMLHATAEAEEFRQDMIGDFLEERRR